MIHEKDSSEIEITEIKFEIFALVDFGDDGLKARKPIIENILKQDEVEQVLKLYIDKMYTHVDVDNICWNTIDLIISTKKNPNIWKETKFKKRIFLKCYLWETIHNCNGEVSREDFKRQQREVQNTQRFHHNY